MRVDKSNLPWVVYGLLELRRICDKQNTKKKKKKKKKKRKKEKEKKKLWKTI